MAVALECSARELTMKFSRFTHNLFAGTLLITTFVVLVISAVVAWRIWDESKEDDMMVAAFPNVTDPDDTLLDSERARVLCQRLEGYRTFRESFDIESAIIGCVNLLPDSLKVSVRTTNRGIVNGVWWWNPLDKNGEPKFNWNDLIRIHADANAVLAKHTWLAEWREVSFGREVELHAFGEHVAETESHLKVFVLPLWRDAGLSGDPGFSVLARRGDTEWAQIYFGKQEARALITAVNQPDRKAKHWLDRLDVYFHPTGKPEDRSSCYAVVEPAGKWQVRTFRPTEP
jgi:hypothetical protein